VPTDTAKEALVAAAKGVANVERYLEGMQIVREIVVPGKLVNLVVKPQG
jgi:leucyl-tRNA synthetase